MRLIHEKTVYQLTFMPILFPVNCYFVEEETGLTLIDAALAFGYKDIIRASEKIGKPITKILLTHVHGDHVGALDALKNTLKDVPVYVSKRDSRLMSGDISLDVDEENLPIKGSVPKNLKTRADILLSDGDMVGSLLAVSAPGHTPGSMAYLDTRNNILIAGDAFQVRGGFAIAGQKKFLFPFPALATWNNKVSLESAKKLRRLNPNILATGHGNMLINPQAAMDKIIKDTEIKIN
ncbi:MBL fold metallo-hydrolase [Clostridium sp. 'White wine YQ']|uniref:MBL fold metallo-hydrolase n=1 Tax=Clostridium sp. 'White wine YQ' TaxID=3027474 RepID=UPI002366B696|nr:MBL fold metallo-hydrolase [Clostridium sp. 'White wine YQ']MDD7795495.1 MBL fold metallo-hydrolase [Clostridium sp. 'White wine YQ']